jgi:hypothetical protein
MAAKKLSALIPASVQKEYQIEGKLGGLTVSDMNNISQALMETASKGKGKVPTGGGCQMCCCVMCCCAAAVKAP